MKSLSPQQLTVAWEYRPDLSFFSAMDQVGIELSDAYEHWFRQSNALALHDRAAHRKLVLAGNRSGYVRVGEMDCDEEIRRLNSQIKRVKGIASNSWRWLRRVGVRVHFAADVGGGVSEICQRVAKKFLCDAWIGNSDFAVSDNSYVVCVEPNDGSNWKARLYVGPMTSAEWPNYTGELDKFMFESESNRVQFKENWVPEAFLYIDVDCFQEFDEKSGLEIDELTESVAFCQRQTTAISRSIMQEYRK